MNRKIDAMHERFGTKDGKCKDCGNLIFRVFGDKSRHVYKCELYGTSCSESTDWRVSYQACGMMNQPMPKGMVPVVRQLVREKKPKIITIDPNQVTMFEGESDNESN